MFSDFGFSELLLIVALGVLLIAPKELPNILKTLYKGYYKILSFKSTMEMKIEEETQQILGHDFLTTLHQETHTTHQTIKNTLSQEKQKIHHQQHPTLKEHES